jgi:hypothetical protein
MLYNPSHKCLKSISAAARWTNWKYYCIGMATLAMFCLIAVLLVKTLNSQKPILYTKTLLLAYSCACTNYFNMYGEWPRSIEDLFVNKSNVVFVYTRAPGKDIWNNPIDFSPFDSNRGFGLLRSYGPGGVNSSNGKENNIIQRFPP